MNFQNQQNNQERESMAELQNCFLHIEHLVKYTEFKSLIAMIKYVQS